MKTTITITYITEPEGTECASEAECIVTEMTEQAGFPYLSHYDRQKIVKFISENYILSKREEVVAPVPSQEDLQQEVDSEVDTPL